MVLHVLANPYLLHPMVCVPTGLWFSCLSKRKKWSPGGFWISCTQFVWRGRSGRRSPASSTAIQFKMRGDSRVLHRVPMLKWPSYSSLERTSPASWQDAMAFTRRRETNFTLSGRYSVASCASRVLQYGQIISRPNSIASFSSVTDFWRHCRIGYHLIHFWL